MKTIILEITIEEIHDAGFVKRALERMSSYATVKDITELLKKRRSR